MVRARWGFPVLMFLVACADNQLSSKDNADSGGAPTDDETGTAADSADTGSVLLPAWYTLAATVVVTEGVPTEATARVQIVHEDATIEICSGAYGFSAITPGTPPAEEIALWWSLEDPVADKACALPLTELSFGIGALDPEVRAVLGQQGMDDAADRLYGAFARVENGDIYAIGYAEADNSEEPAVDVPPDGAYSLVPVFLLALP